jgi:hypothetical protein
MAPVTTKASGASIAITPTLVARRGAEHDEASRPRRRPHDPRRWRHRLGRRDARVARGVVFHVGALGVLGNLSDDARRGPRPQRRRARRRDPRRHEYPSDSSALAPWRRRPRLADPSRRYAVPRPRHNAWWGGAARPLHRCRRAACPIRRESDAAARRGCPGPGARGPHHEPQGAEHLLERRRVVAEVEQRRAVRRGSGSEPAPA